MRAGQYSRGRGDINAYAFKNRSEWIPFYTDWLEDLRGASATEDMPVIEIQTAGEQGAACIYSRGFLVAKAAASYTHYLLFGRDSLEDMLAKGIERMLAYDAYLSAEEFRAMDKPMGTPIEPMAELEIALPDVEVGVLPIAKKGSVVAAMLMEIWKAFFDRYERGGKDCLIPVGCLITSAQRNEALWTDAMALIRSVSQYLPRPVQRMFSVTVGADWSRYNAQSGSAWYICREENIDRGQREGLYDFVHNSFSPRCTADELKLGEALLSGRTGTFYGHIARTDAPDATGETCLCYDVSFAVNLYALEMLLDDAQRTMDERISGALNAWRNLDGVLADYEKRGRLTARQRAFALLPVMQTVIARLAESTLELTLNQTRLLIGTLLNPNLPEAEGEALRGAIRGILGRRSLIKNGKNGAMSLLQVMTSSKDFAPFAAWAAHADYPKMLGDWMLAQRASPFLNEDEFKALTALVSGGAVKQNKSLQAQINRFCAASLQGECSQGRLLAVLNLLLETKTPAWGEEGAAVCSQIGRTLKHCYEGRLIPPDMYRALRSYAHIEGTQLDVARVLTEHVLNLLAVGQERSVFAYVCGVLCDEPRGDALERQQLRDALSAWLDRYWKSADYSDDELKAGAGLIRCYGFEDVLARPVALGIRQTLLPGRGAYLRKVLSAWQVSFETLCPGRDFEAYLLRVYAQRAIDAQELKDILALNNPAVLDALYAHTLHVLESAQGEGFVGAVAQAGQMRAQCADDARSQRLTESVIAAMERQMGGAQAQTAAFMDYMGAPGKAWPQAWLVRTAACLGRVCNAKENSQTVGFMRQFMPWATEQLEDQFSECESAGDAWRTVRRDYLSECFEKSVVRQMTYADLTADRARALWQSGAAYEWMKGTPGSEEAAWQALERGLNEAALGALTARVCELIEENMSISALDEVYKALSAETARGDWFSSRLAQSIKARFDERWMALLTEDLSTVQEANALAGLYAALQTGAGTHCARAKKTVDFVLKVAAELATLSRNNLKKNSADPLDSWLAEIQKLDEGEAFRWGRVAVRLLKSACVGQSETWIHCLLTYMDSETDGIHVDWDGYFKRLAEECAGEKSWEEQKGDPWHDESCLVPLLIWQAGLMEENRKLRALWEDLTAYLSSAEMKKTSKALHDEQRAKPYRKLTGYKTIFGGDN